ncbi:murein hydrolase activator EnvC family protein [Reinekea marina]|uniref:Murein hydrolase activator EnvC family protein n=1 Tax=Reinekea marina TaxID=1310421 RepID=A0ABV7WN22_9GAMM
MNTLLKSLLVTVIALIASLAIADDVAEQKKKLEALNKELLSLQSDLSSKQKDLTSQQKALKQVEVEIGVVQKKALQLNGRIEQLSAEVQANEQAIFELSEALDSKQDVIASILRLAYTQNNQPLIKLLLSGQRPEDYARQLYYFSILTDYQQQTLNQWVQEKRKLAALKSTIEQQRDDLVSQSQLLLEQEKQLKSQKNKRAQVLANLSKEVVSTEKQIQRKVTEREELSTLISDLQEKLDAFSLEFPDAEDIRKLKGKLAWPVTGRLLNSYNGVIDGSQLKWQGVTIAAPAGDPVRAIQAGQVVFADFFRTHGLLIIIDHGNGVMTLYGRNQSLLKEVGSWVETGEVIASVGQSGGHSRSGLYFELRNNGRPENPSSWLKKR